MHSELDPAAPDEIDFGEAEQRPANGEDTAPDRLRIYQCAELDQLPKREYLIKGLIDRRSLAQVRGPYGCSKSFFTTTALFHIALGWDFFGRKVRRGGVIYIAAEGVGTPQRCKAFCQHHDIAPESMPFFVLPTGVDLRSPDSDLAELLQRIEALRPRLEAYDCILEAVAIDTVSRALAGGSDSKSEDMAPFLENCEALKDKAAAAVIGVHHEGVDGGRSRGLTLWPAALDTEIGIAMDRASKTATATIAKQRDGEIGKEMTYSLEVVELGHDEDGDPITSCAVVETDEPARAPNGPRLSANQKTMLTILQQAGPSGLAVEDWNDQARREGLYPKQKQRLYDLRTALKDKRLVHTTMGRWYVSTQD